MPKLPSYNLKQVYDLRRKLYTQVLEPLAGREVAVPMLVRLLQRHLSFPVSVDVLYESLRYLATTPLTRAEAFLLAWRIAGNVHTLRNGHVVPPWTLQRGDEWVPMRITRVVKTRNNYNKVGYSATLQVLAGTPAGLKTTTFWPPGAIDLIARTVGFSRMRGKYPFEGASSLVALRLYGRIEAEKSRTAPYFFEVACPASMVTWNRDQVLKLRLRITEECPRHYAHACWQCAIGYDQCPAGTHAKTYETGACSNCNKDQTVFDPEDPSPYCVACSASLRLKRKK